MNGVIRDIEAYNCALYIGGDFTMVDGETISYIAVWNETSWSTIPRTCGGQSATQPLNFNAAVNTFEVYHGKLAIGGDFTQVVGVPDPLEGLILLNSLSFETLPTHGHIASINQLETYEESLVVGADSVYVYRWDKWYYPQDTLIRLGYAPYFYYQTTIPWTIPVVTNIDDIYYSPPTGVDNEFSNLVISANNSVYALNGKPGEVLWGFPFSSNYSIALDGAVLALGELGDIPFYGGNFSKAIIYNRYNFITGSCTDTVETQKILSLSRQPSSDLPIELAKFTVKSDDHKTVQLAWTSLTENNSLHYEVERKTDNEDFTRVGTVAAAGESLEEINYTYEDDISKVSGNYVYYRLKMVDKDGSYEYSEVRSLKLETRDSGIFIAPNPAVNTVELSMKMAVSGNVNVHIYDMQGRQLCNYQWTYNDNSVVRERIDVSQLEAGLYLVEVVSPDERKTMKLDVLR